MRYPLMPTGVEHLTTYFSTRCRPLMRYPLMPTGVEHQRMVLECVVLEGNALPSDAYGR